MRLLSICALALLPAALGGATERNPRKPRGTVAAVSALLGRIFPTNPDAASHFTLSLTASVEDACPDGGAAPCYYMSDAPGGKVAIVGTGASELSFAVGQYLRQQCNLTIGWPRGGGNHIQVPQEWPKVGATPIAGKRNVPWSYMMNVCTHSYSLVWYSWDQWQVFIDWIALSGINNVLAMTGQEEVQYKVFRALGLKDEDIRGWFNGPALLTWSRGQNEYGNGIAGMLPRSWMKEQWSMQKDILARYRSLGIVGQLPAFQGNVPVQLKALHADANITKQGDTGWMDSLDPLYGKIADQWMKVLIEDFGTDHWYQLDGYFNGGTAPWMDQAAAAAVASPSVAAGSSSTTTTTTASAEIFDAANPADSPQAPPGVDLMAFRRGVEAYRGLNRTDPDAVWSFQGWAFIGWKDEARGERIKGFVEATPEGKFNVIDMSVNGVGEWKKWNESSFYGANYIWTTLHDFGGTDGMKGNLSQINEIPFAGMAPEKDTSVWGTGFTPEGIDQNPVYYEMVIGQNFREARVPDIPAFISERSHRRYGLVAHEPAVDQAWRLLAESAYSQDLNVRDQTGIAHLSNTVSQFLTDRRTPSPILCTIFKAWELLIEAAKLGVMNNEPYRYDLVNLGREILAQLATPLSMNFSDTIRAGMANPNAAAIRASGDAYVDLLNDVDTLLNTDTAFMLGPWIATAVQWAGNNTDCIATGFQEAVQGCAAFYEWNARVQLTTWNPTSKTATKIPDGPIDYAGKHWAGLTRDYYGARATLLQNHAYDAATSGKVVVQAEVDLILAQHAYKWTTSRNAYATVASGDYVAVSKAMYDKYSPYYSACPAA